MDANGEDRVPALFNEATAIAAEYVEWQERRDANRELLRNLARSGVLTPDEKEKVEELYPYRSTFKGQR